MNRLDELVSAQAGVLLSAQAGLPGGMDGFVIEEIETLPTFIQDQEK